MNLLLTFATLLAAASGEASFGVFRIGDAYNRRLETTRRKITTYNFDILALEKKIIGRPQLSLLEEYNTNLLEIMKQRDGETLVYDGLVTGLSLEHARVVAEASAARQAELPETQGEQTKRPATRPTHRNCLLYHASAVTT